MVMGRRKLSSELSVRMNGLRVGSLKRLSTGKLVFSYLDEWMRERQARPLSLSMPVRSEPYSGEVVENYFDNLLPDNQAIRHRIQRKFHAPSDKSFDLLSHIGQDCVGAVQLCPIERDPPPVTRIDASPVTDDDIAKILGNSRIMPLGISGDDEFRISLAGAQEKTALLMLDGQWHRPHGSTPTTHILKLPIGRLEHQNIDMSDSVENEWLCHQLIKEFGIPISEVSMIRFAGVKALVVERFDRKPSEDRSWIVRLPQEDMCQALGVPPALKYESDGGPGIEQIMKLLLGSSRSFEDRKTFLIANFVFWLLAAIDGHAKNFSIFLHPSGGFSLTPLYDVLSAYPCLEKRNLERQKIKMAMAVRGENRHYHWVEILKRHWLRTSTSCHFPADETAAILSEALERIDMAIDRVAERLPAEFPSSVAEPIFNGLLQARERFIRSG
jgi:serine/threonine-protein kinase HipA